MTLGIQGLTGQGWRCGFYFKCREANRRMSGHFHLEGCGVVVDGVDLSVPDILGTWNSRICHLL